MFISYFVSRLSLEEKCDWHQPICILFFSYRNKYYAPLPCIIAFLQNEMERIYVVLGQIVTVLGPSPSIAGANCF
jgi:hypothetical protein